MTNGVAAGGNRLGEYLRARRQQVPAQAYGLADSGRRRVAGLRREELAILAGISVEYYTRLERGRDRNPSPQVLDALARVLLLDAAATAHLVELAAPRRRPADRTPGADPVAPQLERLVHSWSEQPAFVLGRFLDVLAANHLATSLHASFQPGTNIARHLFCDPGAVSVYPDWPAVGAETVAALRSSAAAELDHPRLIRLVGELTLHSAEFTRLWGRHDVRAKTSGTKRISHPLVGELTLHWQALAVPGTSGQMVIVYSAEPGSRSEQGLALLTHLSDGVDPDRTAPQPSATRGARVVGHGPRGDEGHPS